MSHEDTIRAAYDAWNREDLEGYLSALHPDVEIQPVLVILRIDGFTKRESAMHALDAT